MQKIDVKFGPWIEEGFGLFKANLGVLVLAMLLVVLVSGVSFGLLAVPMAAGLLILSARLKDGLQPPPKATDVFKGMELIGQGLLFAVILFAIGLGVFVLNLIPCIGQILVVLLGLAIVPVIYLGICALALDRKPAIEAIKHGLGLAKRDYPKLVAFCLLAGLIGASGSVLCGVGQLFTMPIAYCIMVVAYRDLASQTAQAPLA